MDEWRCIHPGTWERGDYVIERGWGSRECKGPHPMRDGSFCPGNRDHDDKRMWTIMVRQPDNSYDIGEAFPTLREAKGTLG